MSFAWWGSARMPCASIRTSPDAASRSLEPTHNERFIALLSRHWPQWQTSRAELNALPLASARWTE